MSDTAPRVDIVLPSGSAATVPAADLDAAIAAGATIPKTPEDDGGVAGQVAAGVLGAGSTATFGLTDRALRSGAGLAGGLVGGNIQAGNAFRHEVTSNLQAVRERNPGSTMVGEGAGLFLNPMGVSGLGEAVEEGVGARVGEGLLGRMATTGARFGAESAALGAQHQITEDTLGDHDINGQKVFASAAKDGIIGLLAGGTLGAAGHYLGGASSLLRRAPGPASDAALDEIAGVAGAGRAVQRDSRAAQDLVEELRKTGATSEQAATMVDELNHAASASVENGGHATGLVDAVTDLYSGARSGENTKLREVLAKGYGDRAARLAQGEETTDLLAQKMARKGTEAMRHLEDVVDEVQFKNKASQFAKMVDPARLDVQRDTVAKLLQDSDEMMKFWETTAAKGGASGPLKDLRRTWKDASSALDKINPESATAGRDLFIRADKFKRALDSHARWGMKFGLPEAVDMTSADGRALSIRSVADKFRGALEDSSVWGKAGDAQSDWNASFSMAKARADHFKNTLGVSIDQANGVRIPEVDFQKTRGMLSQLKGNGIDDDLQAVKSTQAYIDGLGSRLAKIREHGDLSPGQALKLAKGENSLAEFKSSFEEAKKEAAIVNRVKQQQLEEGAKGMGGLLGIASDIVTKPLTTVERLAQVRSTVKSVEDGVSKGLEHFFGQKGPALVERLAPRPAADVVKEIGQVRELAGDPTKLQAKLADWTGDLAKHAPQIADSVKATAVRAIAYLAQEAPPAMMSASIITMHNQKPRYSDQALSTWEAKRDAVLGRNGVMGPEVIVSEMHQGKLNRDAIKAIQTVSPAMYQQLQSAAQEELKRLSASGKLDDMPYQQQASLASLLQVPAGETWQPDFILMMQAAKAQHAPQQSASESGPPNVSKRAIKLNTNIFSTESGRIEGKDAAA